MSTNSHIEAVENIQKKLLGKHLTYREIYSIMDEISHQRLGDILTTYFVAASFKEGFSSEELFYFTKAMVETGTKLSFPGIVADKHSIGGVAGTRASMIIVPIIAAAGFTIPKTSSRAITSPAGTADVVESIAHVNFTPEQVTRIVEKTGGCMVWNGHLGVAPADDIIIKVEAPLMFESFDKIIVSVMAKKIAMSSNHLILDIPIGKTMKVSHEKDALSIAKKFIDLGARFGMKVIADIVPTQEPAGNGIGPIMEARDVLSVLEQRKDRPLALENRALRLAGKLLDICLSRKIEKQSGYEIAQSILTSGKALTKFQEIIHAQGGKKEINRDDILIRSHSKHILAQKSGKILAINNHHLNTLAKVAGCPTDKYAGLYLLKKTDDRVEKNEPLCSIYSSNRHALDEAVLTYTNIPIYHIST